MSAVNTKKKMRRQTMNSIVVNPEVIKALADCVVDVIANKIDWSAIDWQKVAEKEVSKPTGKWISVSERLPEESLNSVIGWDAYRERCVFVQYIDGHFQITGSDESFNIVAWQPLPEPYQKGGAE